MFFGIGVLGDLAGWSDGPGQRGVLQRIHDALFMTLICPLGLVSLTVSQIGRKITLF